MANLISRRLQVFVSSTYTDLKPERQAAVEAILTGGHIPAGMELFTAGDESQMDVIRQWIDDSDVFLLILGGRYGSIEKNSGKSYIELEYEHAVEVGKPYFACVMSNDINDARVKRFGPSVMETKEPQKFSAFKDRVLSRISEFWTDERDIQITVHKKLAEFERREDLVGWVRGSESVDVPVLAEEIARLSKENADLRSRAATEMISIQGLSYGEVKSLLQQKELWEFLISIRDRLLRGLSSQSGDENSRCMQLRGIGLLQVSGNRWRLTNEGIMLLNRYDIEQLESTQN